MNPLDIDSLATVDSVAGTPWEKVGAIIPANATVNETLIAADLNWDVVKAPISAVVSVPRDPIQPGEDPKLYRRRAAELHRTIRVPNSYTLFRKPVAATAADILNGNWIVLSPYMGERYHPVQNRDAFEIFDDFVRAGNMRMETAGSLSGGKHIWGLASIQEGFELVNGEIIKGYFLLVQSHKYGHSLRAMFTPIRFPGGHSLVQAISRRGTGSAARGTYKMPHSRIFDDTRRHEIKEILQVAKANLAHFANTAKTLSETPMTEAQSVFYAIETFQPELIGTFRAQDFPDTFEELAEKDSGANRTLRKMGQYVQSYPGAELPTCKGTLWGMFQCVQHVVDSQIGRSVDTRLQSAWLGKGASIKNRALDSAINIVNEPGRHKKAS